MPKITIEVTQKAFDRLARLKARYSFTWKQLILMGMIKYCKRGIELDDHVALHKRDIEQFQHELQQSPYR